MKETVQSTDQKPTFRLRRHPSEDETTFKHRQMVAERAKLWFDVIDASDISPADQATCKQEFQAQIERPLWRNYRGFDDLIYGLVARMADILQPSSDSTDQPKNRTKADQREYQALFENLKADMWAFWGEERERD